MYRRRRRCRELAAAVILCSHHPVAEGYAAVPLPLLAVPSCRRQRQIAFRRRRRSLFLPAAKQDTLDDDDEEDDDRGFKEINSTVPKTQKDDQSISPSAILAQQQQQQPTQRRQREPDSPDRAISIVAELKANAALFAAFAYGGLSIPSALTVSESKVTSVTTSISVTRPLPGSHLIQAFVVLDACTLCLMISCVAASQLLIYRLTDGSWYDIDTNDDDTATDAQPSALGRLVTQYRTEFTVARTTFDLGLVALLLAVAVRAIAIFDASIAVPVAILLGGTALALGIGNLGSYVQVFSNLEQEEPPNDNVKTAGKGDANRQPDMISWIGAALVTAPSILAAVYFVGAAINVYDIASQLGSYSSAAGEAKLKVVTDKVAGERAAATETKERTREKSKRPSSKEKTTEEKRSKRSEGTQEKDKNPPQTGTSSAQKFTSGTKEVSAAEMIPIENEKKMHGSASTKTTSGNES